MKLKKIIVELIFDYIENEDDFVDGGIDVEYEFVEIGEITEHEFVEDDGSYLVPLEQFIKRFEPSSYGRFEYDQYNSRRAVYTEEVELLGVQVNESWHVCYV